MQLGSGGRQLATLTGKTIKATPCEGCGHTYYYLLARTLHVTLSAADELLAGTEGGWHQAMHRAHKTLEQMLAGESDPVPCPVCGWYQQDMLARARELRFRGLLTYPAVAWLLLGVLSGIAAGLLTDASRRGAPEEGISPTILVLAWSVAASGLLIGAACLLARWRRRRCYDPNGEPVGVRQELGRLMTLTPEALERARKELRHADALRQWRR